MNNELTNKIYPGKVLLFGEYTVIHGGDSLAIPLYKKHASWNYDDLEFESRESLDKFIDYLIVNGIIDLDIDRFKEEWEDGLFLESNIPSGYGAGSSGSVVAALYDGFVNEKVSDLKELRIIFQKMENCFHGSSSGIDPLVSYLGKGIHIHNGEVHPIDLEENPILHKLYLWDSNYSRTTGPLVEWYKQELMTKLFKKQIEEELLPLNTKLISSFIKGNERGFLRFFAAVEAFQKNHLRPMFPKNYYDQLEQFKKQGAMYKLCGAGGGGYYLLYFPEPPEDKSKLIPIV